MQSARRLFALVLCLDFGLLTAWADEPPVRYDNHKLVDVRLDTPQDLMRMLSISEDHWSCSPMLGHVPFHVAPERMDALKASGLEYRVLNENIQALFDAERTANEQAQQLRGGWFTSYHPYADVATYVDTLVALRPDLATRFSVGNSLQNRDIFGIRITGPSGPAGKPALLFEGCQHAREWVAVSVPMYIADKLIRTYDTDAYVHTLLDRVVVYIIPIVNPDGYQFTWDSTRLWRKNRRNNGDGTFGVDTNRNWSVGWGLDSGSSGSTNSETYRGTAPFSEPEPTRIRDFVLAHPEIVTFQDFHSYGQLILSPYGYFEGEPAEPDRTTFNTLDTRMQSAIEAVHGETYVTGPISTTLYLASGSAVDWGYDAGGAYAFTIELRPDTDNPGFVLPPDQIIPTCEENWEGAKVLFDFVSTAFSFVFPNGLPTSTPAEQTSTIAVNIVNNGGTYQSGTAQQFVRIGTSGAFTPSPLTPAGGTAFTATLPAAGCGQTIQYYFSAQSTGGQTITSPADAPTSVHSANAVQTTVVFTDDMEIDLGWTSGAAGDNATTGLWVRVNPVGTSAQPEDDHTPTPGVTCWVTGQGAVGGQVGAADVDGGRTTLVSPVVSLTSDLNDPYVKYWRWYSNDQGGAPNADVFRVEIQVNGGTFTAVETVGPTGAETGGGWFFHQARLRDFAPTLPATVRLRFIADDAGTGSVIEAAVDDFAVTDSGCPTPPACVGDINGDHVRDLNDLTAMLAAFGASEGQPGYNAAADLDGNHAIDLNDLSAMLSNFGTPCP